MATGMTLFYGHSGYESAAALTELLRRSADDLTAAEVKTIVKMINRALAREVKKKTKSSK